MSAITTHAITTQSPVGKGVCGSWFGTAKIVLKPERGTPVEAQREHAAFLLGSVLGVPVVPGFVVPGEGWCSAYVSGLEEYGARFNYSPNTGRVWIESNADLLAKCAAFDWIIGNGDRHSGNLGFDGNGDLVLYDHGYCFSPPRWTDDNKRKLYSVSMGVYWDGVDAVPGFMDMVKAHAKDIRTILTHSLVLSIMRTVGRVEDVEGVLDRLSMEPFANNAL